MGAEELIKAGKEFAEVEKALAELSRIYKEAAEAGKMGEETAKVLAESQKALEAAKLSLKAGKSTLEAAKLAGYAEKVEMLQEQLKLVSETQKAFRAGNIGYGTLKIVQEGPKTGWLKALADVPKAMAGLGVAAGVTFIGAAVIPTLWQKGTALRNDQKMANPKRTYEGKDYLLIPIKEKDNKEKDNKVDFYLGAIPGVTPGAGRRDDYQVDEKGCVLCYLLPADQYAKDGPDAFKQLKTRDGKLVVATSNLKPEEFLLEAIGRMKMIKEAAKDVPGWWEFWRYGDVALQAVKNHNGIIAGASTEMPTSIWEKISKWMPWVGIAAGAAITLMVPSLALVGLPLAAISFFAKDKITEFLSPGSSTNRVVIPKPGEDSGKKDGEPAAPKPGAPAPAKTSMLDGSKGKLDMPDSEVLADARRAVAESAKGFQVSSTSMGAMIPTKKGEMNIS